MKQVLLVGNPNSGKTTLFNNLASADEHTGNWHGVTVENKQKIFDCNGKECKLVDTPGIYSLDALSYEEKVACDFLFKNSSSKVINLCDRDNLQRNLYLTLCLIEGGFDIVVVINNIKGHPIFKIDCKKLSDVLGVDVVNINASNKEDMTTLKRCLDAPKKTKKLSYHTSEFEGLTIEEKAKKRYEFIENLILQCTVRTSKVYGESKFDKVALNKWLALPVFLLILATVFYLTFFSLGTFLSDKLGLLLSFLTNPLLRLIENAVGKNWIFDLFNVAIFGGLSTILAFLPQVVLLFFFLSVLEDSGYMSRVAFIFEDILGQIGLSGKSVYTLLMGFGCSTTAIMTARNMDDKNAKTKTAILCPYMSCSAKIPIYLVVGGAFLGSKNIWMIVSLYVLGVIVAICLSKILDKTVLKSKEQSFILEFPPYRMMSIKRVSKVLWKNVKEFLIKVGSIMITMNIIVWILSSFSFSFAYVKNGNSQSMLEFFGKVLAPIFVPLGFGNWAIVSALLSGFVAKEVLVSAIAMFNGIDASATKLLSQSILSPQSVISFSSTASVISFLVYCLLYTPCVSSVSMLKQEVGTKWTILAVILQLFVAYVVSFFVYNVVFAFEIFGFWETLFCVGAVGLFVFSLCFVTKKIRSKSTCSGCKFCDKKCLRKK